MKKIISLAVVCLLMFSLCACNIIGGANSKTSIQTGKNYQVGDTVEVSNVEVTFIGVTKSTGPDGAVYLGCEFEVANKTTEALAISSILSFAGYCDGYACGVTLNEDAEATSPFDGEIPIAGKVKGTIIYKVAPDWKELQVHFKPFVLQDNAVIFVVTNN